MAANNVAAESSFVTIPATDYRAILNRLAALQKRVELLESAQSAPSAQTVAKQSVPDQKTCGDDINYLYETIDNIETKQLRDKLNFGAELRSRVDNYTIKNFNFVDVATYKDNLRAGASYLEGAQNALVHRDQQNDNNNWFNRFRLTMQAQVTDSIDFHGRMYTSNYWGDTDSGDIFFDRNQVFLSEKQQTFNVDRFYINWLPKGLPLPLALTIGRQPATEGPPFSFKENTQRQSTYPALLFNGIADGIVATVGLDKITHLANNGLRLAYAKAYHSDNDSYMHPFPFIDDDEAQDANIFAAFFESEIPGLPDSLMVFSYALLQDLPTTFFGPLQQTYQFKNDNIGDMNLWGVHLQAKNILESNIDLFFSYAGNHSSPDRPTELGLLSWGNTKSFTGHAFYAGLRYTFASDLFNEPKVGFEYNHGSRYWYSMTVGSPDPFNKLATRGSVYDFYYIQPVNKHMFFRFGFTSVSYDYTASGQYIGKPEPSGMTLNDLYLLMNIRF